AETLKFAPGEKSKTITVPIINDGEPEPLESFKVLLRNALPVSSLLLPNEAIVSIQDDDPAIHFVNAQFNVRENDGAIQIGVVRENGLDLESTVGYATRDGSARAGADYSAVSGTLIFFKGETFKSIAIPVQNDTETEGPETFQIILSNPGPGVGLLFPSTAE